MAKNTPNLGLYKKDAATDRADTFNITTMLNDNWDKIDEAVAQKADNSAATKKYITTVGDGTNTEFTINHGLNTLDIVVSVRTTASPYMQLFMYDVDILDSDSIKVLFGDAPTLGEYQITIVG